MRLYAENPGGGHSPRAIGGLTPDSILWRRSTVDQRTTANALLVYSGRDRDCPPGALGNGSGSNSPFETLHYADRQLAYLRKLKPDWDGDQGQPPTADSIIAMHQAIKRVSDRRTIYPFLNPDGTGGIVAEWHADGQVLEILSEANGETYFYGKNSDGELLIDARDEDAEAINSYGYASSNRRKFRKLLVALSLYVHHANPAWRELFK